MKRLTKKDWRALGIWNSHGICKQGVAGVYVGYVPADNGRLYRAPRWQVFRPGFKTDPGSHWTDNGNKTFTVYDREHKEAKRLEAIAWASFVYDIKGEWECDPWGDWHPEGTLEAARRACEAVKVEG